MATAKQIAANRLNSKQPRTPEAKAASRFNALKHGIYAEHQIMFDETEEDLAELAAEYHEQHAPANPTERELVDTLIHNEWRLRRMRRVEAVLWEHAANTYLAQHPDEPGCNSAHAFVTNSGQFERLQRIVNACERNYHRALKEIRHLQATKVGQALSSANPELQQSKPTSPDIGPFRQNPNPSETATPPAPKNSPETPAKAAKEAADAQALADESFRSRLDAMRADAMARYGKK